MPLLFYLLVWAFEARVCIANPYYITFFTERQFHFIIRRKFSLEDGDLGNEEQGDGNEDKRRLEVLSKELVKAKKRQMSIIDAIHDQRNILLALAAKAGVDTHEEDAISSNVNH